jgi:hypothetical protein
MPTLDVFRNSELIAFAAFQRQLMILKDLDGNLRWEMDDELRKAGGGAIQIWALRELEGYSIRFVLPAWTLVIDGVMREHELYEDVRLSGQQVELKYHDYQFVFR